MRASRVLRRSQSGCRSSWPELQRTWSSERLWLFMMRLWRAALLLGSWGFSWGFRPAPVMSAAVCPPFPVFAELAKINNPIELRFVAINTQVQLRSMAFRCAITQWPVVITTPTGLRSDVLRDVQFIHDTMHRASVQSFYEF